MTFPENDAAVGDLLWGQAAARFFRVEDDHLIQRDAHFVRGVSAQVLVGEEDDFFTLGKCPAEDRTSVAAGATGPAVAATKGFDVGGGVDIRNRDDIGLALFGEEVPGVFEGVQLGHVGHAAPGGQIGQDDGDAVIGKDVGGLGHEMDAAEDDEVGLFLLGADLRKLQAVAGEVGEANDFILLVVVT